MIDMRRGCTSSRSRWIFGAHDRAVHPQILMGAQLYTTPQPRLAVGLWQQRFPPLHSFGWSPAPARPASGIAELRAPEAVEPWHRQRVPVRHGAGPHFAGAAHSMECTRTEAGFGPHKRKQAASSAARITVDGLGKRRCSQDMTNASGSAPYAEPVCLVCGS